MTDSIFFSSVIQKTPSLLTETVKMTDDTKIPLPFLYIFYLLLYYLLFFSYT